jgi:hypothetical protein
MGTKTRLAKKLFKWSALGRAWTVFVIFITVTFGWAFDFPAVFRHEDDKDARRATVRMRWLSVFLAFGLVAWFAATTSSFMRSVVETTRQPWLSWAAGGFGDLPAVAWVANLPVGASAVLASLFIWGVVARRITASQMASKVPIARQATVKVVGANPKPFAHSWQERREATPRFWLMVGFALVPSGLWLVLRGFPVEHSLNADQLAGWLTVAAIAYAAYCGVTAARTMRKTHAGTHKTDAVFDERLSMVLDIKQSILAEERAKPAGERKYRPEYQENGWLKITLPPDAWEAVSAVKRRNIPGRLKDHMPNKEMLDEHWPQGITLLPVSEKEEARRENIALSGDLTDAPLGFVDPDDDGTWLTPAPY